MDKALAIIEYSTVASGIRSLDWLTKTADIDIVTAQTVCPGKFMILFYGELSAVHASMQAARLHEPEHEIDRLVLGNPAETLISALYGTTCPSAGGALGLIETFTGASAVLAADTAAKTAHVSLTEVRLSRGLCGKSYAMLTGSVAAVEAALEAARKAVADSGMLLDIALIANPDAKMSAALM